MPRPRPPSPALNASISSSHLSRSIPASPFGELLTVLVGHPTPHVAASGRARERRALLAPETLAVAVEPRRHRALVQLRVGCPQVDRARASGAARAALSSPRPHTAGARSIGYRSSSLRCRGWPAVARSLRIRAASGWSGQQAHGSRYGRTPDLAAYARSSPRRASCRGGRADTDPAALARRFWSRCLLFINNLCSLLMNVLDF